MTILSHDRPSVALVRTKPLAPPPTFTTAAEMRAHYKDVRSRINCGKIEPPPPVQRQSFEVKIIDHLRLIKTSEPASVIDIPKFIPVWVGEEHTVVDIIPSQFGVDPAKVKHLSPEAERIGARRAIRAIFAEMARDPLQSRLNMVVRECAKAFKVDRSALTLPSRKFGVRRMRHITFAIARKFEPNSLKRIGAAIGGRDHTTALNSVRKAGPLIEDIFEEARSS